MGGFGAGRLGERTKTEDCWSLDVTRLHREGRLEPGHHSHLPCTRNGRVVASVSVLCEGHKLVLSYWLRGVPETIEYPVRLTWSPCTKGGRRPYFLCPGRPGERGCRRRVAKLYRRDRYFLCRHCQELSYTSQSEARHYCLIRRRNKLLASLDPRADQFDLNPPRPKGMWQRTYEARLTEIWRLEEEAMEAAMRIFGGVGPEGSLEDLGY